MLLGAAQVYSGEWTNPGIFMLSLNAGWKPAGIDLAACFFHVLLTGAIYKHSEVVAASWKLAATFSRSLLAAIKRGQVANWRFLVPGGLQCA